MGSDILQKRAVGRELFYRGTRWGQNSQQVLASSSEPQPSPNLQEVPRMMQAEWVGFPTHGQKPAWTAKEIKTQAHWDYPLPKAIASFLGLINMNMDSVFPNYLPERAETIPEVDNFFVSFLFVFLFSFLFWVWIFLHCLFLFLYKCEQFLIFVVVLLCSCLCFFLLCFPPVFCISFPKFVWSSFVLQPYFWALPLLLYLCLPPSPF